MKKQPEEYQKGEFCAFIKCNQYSNLLMGRKGFCSRCPAYKFHQYIQENFEPLKRKK